MSVRRAHSLKNLSFVPTALEPKVPASLLKPHWLLYSRQLLSLNEMLDEHKVLLPTLADTVRKLNERADTAHEARVASECFAHEIYFHGFTEVPERRKLGARLGAELELQFESVETLLQLLAFNVAALEGHGWVWVVCVDGQLEILPLRYGESFLTRADADKIVPIFALDACEHAYYPTFLQDYRAYVDAWWACQDLVQAEQALIPALRRAGLD